MRAILDKDYERLEKMAVEASSFVLGVALQESCYDYEIVKLLIGKYLLHRPNVTNNEDHMQRQALPLIPHTPN